MQFLSSSSLLPQLGVGQVQGKGRGSGDLGGKQGVDTELQNPEEFLAMLMELSGEGKTSLKSPFLKTNALIFQNLQNGQLGTEISSEEALAQNNKEDIAQGLLNSKKGLKNFQMEKMNSTANEFSGKVIPNDIQAHKVPGNRVGPLQLRSSELAQLNVNKTKLISGEGNVNKESESFSGSPVKNAESERRPFFPKNNFFQKPNANLKGTKDLGEMEVPKENGFFAPQKQKEEALKSKLREEKSVLKNLGKKDQNLSSLFSQNGGVQDTESFMVQKRQMGQFVNNNSAQKNKNLNNSFIHTNSSKKNNILNFESSLSENRENNPAQMGDENAFSAYKGEAAGRGQNIRGTDGKVLDMGQVKDLNSNQIFEKVVNYIKQSGLSRKPSVELTVSDNSLGEFKIQVKNSREKGTIDLEIITKTDRGNEFFNENEKGLIKNLGNAGFKVADFKLMMGKDQGGINSEFRSFKDSLDNQFNGDDKNSNSSYKQQKHSQDSDSERRKELWEEFKERFGA